MNRPLYQDAAYPAKQKHTGHAGLRYEKYGAFWRCNEEDPLEWNLKADKVNSPKLDWVSDVAGTGYAPQKYLNLLAEHHERMQMFFQQQNAVSLYFRTISRLVTGIGQDHPVENGFLWHPTLGVPYLPGSSLKGMLKNWLLTWNWEGSEHLQCWFEKKLVGTRTVGVGELIFFDALPCEVPTLLADVITPHYGPYYRDVSGTIPPADWHSPTPTPFLTVAKDQTFRVCVARRDCAPMADDEREAVETALRHALETIGIGAKTAIGYGRLEDRLEEIKKFCCDFTDFRNQKGRQDTLAGRIGNLSVGEQQAASMYLREKMGVVESHYRPALRAIVFQAPQP